MKHIQHFSPTETLQGTYAQSLLMFWLGPNNKVLIDKIYSQTRAKYTIQLKKIYSQKKADNNNKHNY